MKLLPDGIEGHSANRAALARDLERDRLASCYLFAGPSGIGKRLVAIEFLRAYLCPERGEKGVACGRCASCRASEFKDGHIDLHLVDPPPGSGRFEITKVRKEVIEIFDLVPKLSPRRGMVIDGAERLSEEAQNALLKTLEEPPEDACLILIATTEVGLLPTILSRARFLRFGRLTRAEALAALGRVELDWQPSPADLLDALELAEGSPGYAQELLQYELFSERETFADWLRSGAPPPAEMRELMPGVGTNAKNEGTWAERSERMQEFWQFALVLAGRELRRAHGIFFDSTMDSSTAEAHLSHGEAAQLRIVNSARVWTECSLRALGDLESMVTPELLFELWAAALPRAVKQC
jgi:hypothetical protein